MKQRREDARGLALVVGSGAMGVIAALAGVALVGSSPEVRDQPESQILSFPIHTEHLVKAPVVYVDGVRLDGTMEDLAPHDIESIQVIKRDAAVETYGREGRSGVVIIRKRKPGK